ncbi:hypothetical protein [uncultured Chryseobacterium sp.]|nr:hypothetical protein [uncultured Chryseobacterium sp.]
MYNNLSTQIKVSPEGVIIEGNHRYTAGRIFRIESKQVPGTLPSSQAGKVVPMNKTTVDKIDWDPQ